LGLTGLVGAGRTELLQSIFGARRMKSGVIKIDGRKVTINNTKDAIDMGMALVPENRKEEGLFLKMTVQDNMNILIYKKLKSLLGLIDKRKSQDKANEYLNKFKIKTPSLLQNIRNLSGGNQQKTIIARWLMNNPKILFMDEPTRGIDVGAKNEVYRIIDSLCKQGVSIVLLSSELPEVLSMCDRIMVMHNGRLKGILMNNEADQTKIMSYTLQEA